MSGTRKASARQHHRNLHWSIWRDEEGSAEPDQVQIAVMQDIRDELQKLNELLGCINFRNIPHVLTAIRGHADAIRRNTNRKRRKRKAAK
jgi:hypothetical protein